jgi:hypothetical protein
MKQQPYKWLSLITTSHVAIIGLVDHLVVELKTKIGGQTRGQRNTLNQFDKHQGIP